MSNTTSQQQSPKLKSVKLTHDEKIKLKRAGRNYPTQQRFAEAFGIARPSLLRILSAGTGSEDNINKVREKLSESAN